VSSTPLPDRPVVLITGCSSGIGLSTALRFARKGYWVFATMRDPSRGDELRDRARAEGLTLTILALDVSRDESVAEAVDSLLRETGGRVDVVVNNAGFVVMGPIETTSPDELRAQLETNLIGVLRVCRAVLPAMRARQGGAIVNLSSVSGRVVLPVAGPYHVSKWGLEALTEALRYEVARFGIRVTLVEPGPFDTPIHAKEWKTKDSLAADSPYRALVDGYHATSGAMRRGDPEDVVTTIWKAATARRPKLRWPVGFFAKLGCFFRPRLPDFLWEWYVRRTFGKDRR
jgi:NAD(P)-dependent dehydrogenase (short-subunit alcohol dehydrogenase family)